MVVITMVDRQFAQSLTRELTGAAAAHVRVHFQSFVAIAHFLVPFGISQNAVKLGSFRRMFSHFYFPYP